MGKIYPKILDIFSASLHRSLRKLAEKLFSRHSISYSVRISKIEKNDVNNEFSLREQIDGEK